MRNLSRFRKVEKTPPKPPTLPDGVPSKFARLRGAQVYFSEERRRLVITAEPCEEADPNGVVHNCDANGCGWEHRITSFELSDQEIREFNVCEMYPKS